MKDKLFDKFLKYEVDNHLFDIEYESFKIWEILRSYVYIELEIIYNNLQPLFPVATKKIRKKTSFKTLKNSLKLFFEKDKDLLFLNNPRRVKQTDNKYYCIYTDLFIDSIKNEYSCVTLEDPYWSLSKISPISHFEPVKTENICYLDIMEYIFQVKKFFLKKINKKKYMKLHNLILFIEKDIEKEFKCDLSEIFKMAEDKLLYMILLKKNYRRIIDRINPKAILEFYDVFPSKILVNKIAKEKNIPIIEIQHGVVTSNNPIFLKYLDTNKRYDCIPDYVFSYGERLLNREYMPIKQENIYYIGSLFLEQKKNEYKNLKSDKKNILFISQSNLGEYISEFASKLADLLKDKSEYQIIYKMHPYEIGREYECLNKKNITVINNREKDLYYYQSISTYQVGIYSTGLYEGLAFDLKTFIINHDYGTKEIKEILKEDDEVIYVNKPEDVLKNILTKNRKKRNYNMCWENVEHKNIEKYLEEIINR